MKGITDQRLAEIEAEIEPIANLHIDVDEGDFSLYFHGDQGSVPFSDDKTAAKKARAVCSAIAASSDLLAEVRRLRAERSGGWAKRAVAEQKRADEAEARAEKEYSRANDVSGKLMAASVGIEKLGATNHALKERADKAEAERGMLAKELVGRGLCVHRHMMCRKAHGIQNNEKLIELCASCFIEWAAEAVKGGE